MKSAEVVRFLGLGDTAGFKYLKHLEANNILKPIRLPGLKTHAMSTCLISHYLTFSRTTHDCPTPSLGSTNLLTLNLVFSAKMLI